MGTPGAGMGFRAQSRAAGLQGHLSSPTGTTWDVLLCLGAQPQHSSAHRSPEHTLKRSQALLASSETESQSLVKYGRNSWLQA